jgi:hypothetical protein
VTVVLTLADGEAREAACDAFGSYSCPFCAGTVSSPEGWAQMQRENAVHYATRDEHYEARPYPEWEARVWAARGCGNPACVVQMTAGALALCRARQGEQAERAAAEQRRHASIMASLAASKAADDALWHEMSVKALDAGQCIECLRASSWRYGRAKLVRHRDPANCPRKRRYAA